LNFKENIVFLSANLSPPQPLLFGVFFFYYYLKDKHHRVRTLNEKAASQTQPATSESNVEGGILAS
jgi:hypothetical protein